MKNANLISFIQENNLAAEQLTAIEIQELYKLVQEIKSKNFQYSSELSQYITKNRLGNKYPNISGVVTMEGSGSSWRFKGGFPSKIYRIVCTILDLRNYGSRSRVVGFESFASLGY